MDFEIRRWEHDHAFDRGNTAGERGTRAVAWLTAATMVVEIVAGWWYNSMALLADGFHMSSHALAIGLSAFAYAAARRYASDPRFAFGTWKIEILGGFASAVLLLAVVALMVLRISEAGPRARLAVDPRGDRALHDRGQSEASRGERTSAAETRRRSTSRLSAARESPVFPPCAYSDPGRPAVSRGRGNARHWPPRRFAKDTA